MRALSGYLFLSRSIYMCNWCGLIGCICALKLIPLVLLYDVQWSWRRVNTACNTPLHFVVKSSSAVPSFYICWIVKSFHLMIPQILSSARWKKYKTLEKKSVLKTDGGQLEWKLDLKRHHFLRLPMVRNKNEI